MRTFAVLLVCTLLYVNRVAAQIPATPNCGIVSTLALAQMQNRSASASDQDRLLKEYPQTTVSVVDVRTMAKSLGINLNGVKATLDELLATQRPAIIHLSQPEHFVLLLDGSRNSLRLLEDAASPIVVPRIEIEKRFDGYALMLQDNLPKTASVPRVRFDETDFQFGVVGVGQKVEHNYRFTNLGKQPLTVNIYKTSCGCTGAIAGTEGNSVTVKPGESSQIRVQTDVQSAGNVQQVVTLKTNDALRPLLYLTIRGTAPQNLQLSAQTLAFGTEKGQSSQRDFQIVGPLAMNVTEVKVDNPFLSATRELVTSDAIKKTWRVRVVQTKEAPVGEFDSTLIIRTTHAERPVITVPIKSIVRGDLQVTPPSAFFGFVEKNEVKNVALVLQSRTGTPFKVVHARLIENKLQALHIDPIDGARTSEHKITVHLATDRALAVDDQLVIETDVHGEEKLLIPVTALIEDEESIAPTDTSADADVTPRQLLLGLIRDGATVRKTIIVQSRNDKSFSISSLTSSNAYIAAKTSPDVVASAHAVEVDVTPRGEAGTPIQERVTLLLSDNRTLDVNIFGTIAPKEDASTRESKIEIQEGQLAPDFAITDMNGALQTLAARRGQRNLLLTFFPKCFTGGCANHLSSLRDVKAQFDASQTDVLAVSVDAADGEKGQRAFAAQWQLNFPLLPDTDRKLSLLYGAAQTPTDLASRMTVLIDKSGIIRWIDRDVNVKTHGADVLAKMRELGMMK